jgi:hypothetical protein
VFCETRQLADEDTYRFLVAAHAWADTEASAIERIGTDNVASSDVVDTPPAPKPSTVEVRAWTQSRNIAVPDRGRLKSGKPGEPPSALRPPGRTPRRLQ